MKFWTWKISSLKSKCKFFTLFDCFITITITYFPFFLFHKLNQKRLKILFPFLTCKLRVMLSLISFVEKDVIWNHSVELNKKNSRSLSEKSCFIKKLCCEWRAINENGDRRCNISNKLKSTLSRKIALTTSSDSAITVGNLLFPFILQRKDLNQLIFDIFVREVKCPLPTTLMKCLD